MLKRISITILLTGILAAPVFVSAQDKSPCHEKAFNDFDFWIGRWDVHIKDGKQAGVNHISKSERGCMLLESWKSIRGTSGTSINYYDPGRKKWYQHWVGDSGDIIHISGNLIDGSMVLTGVIYYIKENKRYDFRGKWTPLEDGRVRQFFEQADDSGENWSPWFEGFYTRKK